MITRSDRKKWIRRLAIGAGLILSVLLILYMTLRQGMLDRAIDRVETSFHARFGGQLTIRDAHFSDWRSVALDGISIVSPQEDTLFSLSHFMVRLRVLPLFTGRVLPASVSMSDGGLRVVYCDSLETNYHWLSGGTSAVTQPRVQKRDNLNDRVGRLIDALFRWLPDEVDILQVGLLVDYVGNEYQLIADQVDMRQGRIAATFSMNSPLLRQQGQVRGTVNRRGRQFDLTLSGEDGRHLTLPGAYEMAGLWTALADARISLSGFQADTGHLHVQLEGQTDKLYVSHPRLSDSLVTLPLLAMASSWEIGPQSIALDSTSTWTVDQVSGRMGARLQLHPSRSLGLLVRMPSTSSEAFFASLPTGMFRQLEGLETEGRLSYSFDFFLQEDSLDNTVIRSRLTPDQFRIIRYGRADLGKMNRTFLHEVYESDRKVAQFLVGPENPDFIPLELISPFLRQAILTCEDPSFFSHHGFLEDAIRESLIQNVREKRFARGGSTISMQLVKNVFLNRKKFLARKIEEILLVWLIEGQRISTKERMYEVYLNLIEWGPGIYGIGQASSFYFNKPPDQLDLSESIFLASIVPKPKKYRWYFEGDQLRPQWQEFNRFIANRMASRGLIPPVDSVGFTGQITLLGPAAGTLSLTDSTGLDSLLMQPLDLLPADWPIPQDSL